MNALHRWDETHWVLPYFLPGYRYAMKVKHMDHGWRRSVRVPGAIVVGFLSSTIYNKTFGNYVWGESTKHLMLTDRVNWLEEIEHPDTHVAEVNRQVAGLLNPYDPNHIKLRGETA